MRPLLSALVILTCLTSTIADEPKPAAKSADAKSTEAKPTVTARK